MADKFLYEELGAVSKMGFLKKEIPEYLKNNLNPKFELRLYQIEAFARFFHCLDNDFPGKDWPLHFLFNMATGSRTTNLAPFPPESSKVNVPPCLRMISWHRYSPSPVLLTGALVVKNGLKMFCRIEDGILSRCLGII
jgi:hypothetical protein